jgi:hypothetical protein
MGMSVEGLGRPIVMKNLLCVKFGSMNITLMWVFHNILEPVKTPYQTFN